MKIKSIALVLLVIATMLLLSACGMQYINEETTPEKQTPEKQFRIVEDYDIGRVIVDKETGVMYWLSMGYYNSGTLTILVNPDGTPKTYGVER